MKFFKRTHDGGPDSKVTGFWLIEWKQVFSIVLLKFESNHRENYHSHAFNAVTWWLHGRAIEEFIDSPELTWTPSIKPKYTPRSLMHKYSVAKTSWAISFRGPWVKTWKEYSLTTKEFIILSNGRKEIDRIPKDEYVKEYI